MIYTDLHIIMFILNLLMSSDVYRFQAFSPLNGSHAVLEPRLATVPAVPLCRGACLRHLRHAAV